MNYGFCEVSNFGWLILFWIIIESKDPDFRICNGKINRSKFSIRTLLIGIAPA